MITKDQVIAMAKRAGFGGLIRVSNSEQFIEFAQFAYAKGLEDAAKECDRLSTAIDHGGKEYRRDSTSSHCALAIRALTLHGDERQDGHE